eukprot:7383512-Prymnesium_polylepis.2
MSKDTDPSAALCTRPTKLTLSSISRLSGREFELKPSLMVSGACDARHAVAMAAKSFVWGTRLAAESERLRRAMRPEGETSIARDRPLSPAPPGCMG